MKGGKNGNEDLWEWGRKYHARIDDPDTSWIAQLLLNEEYVQALLRMDLVAHGRNPGGLRDEKVREEIRRLWPDLKIHDRGDSKRCSDLEKHCGFLEDSGKREPNEKTGRLAKVRRITEKGVSALATQIRIVIPRPKKKKGGSRPGVEIDLDY